MTSGHDEEMARLNQVIADLKRQNAFLRGMLTDAIVIVPSSPARTAS